LKSTIPVLIKKILSGIFKSKIIRDSFNITIWNTIGKAAAFLIPFFIAAFFGISDKTDAFFYTYTVVLFASGIVTPALEKITVPFIYEAKKNQEDISRFIGSIFMISTILLLLLSGILLSFLKPLLSFITRFDPKEIDLIFILFLELIPFIVLLCWTSILTGLLNADKRFVLPSVSPLLRAIVNLLMIVIFKNILGVHSIAMGYIAGEFFRFIILFIYIYRKGVCRIRFGSITKKTIDFLKISSYQVLSMVIVGLYPIIDKTMASWLEKGSVSILEYASRLYDIPQTFVGTGIMVVLLSYWSDNYYKYGRQRLKNDVIKAIKVISIISIFISFLLILLNKQIVTIAFGRGEFDLDQIPLVAGTFTFFMFGFLSFTINTVFVQAHIVLKNTKILLFGGIFIIIFNIIFNYILMMFFKVSGIAISTSLTSTFALLYFGIYFLKSVNTVKIDSRN